MMIYNEFFFNSIKHNTISIICQKIFAKHQNQPFDKAKEVKLKNKPNILHLNVAINQF